MKRALSLILSIVTSISLFSCLTTSVSAGNFDTILTAKSVSMNTISSGSLTSEDPTDIFKFTLGSSSKVDVELHSTVFRFQFFLMNESGQVIYSGGKEEGASGLCTLLDSMVLVKGVYYFRVTKNNESRNGTYEITFKSSSASESFAETESDNNNSILTADSIIASRNYKGQIALNDKSDFYVLNLPTTSTFSLNFMSDDVDACYVDILDEKGTNVKGWYLTQGTNDCVINSSLLLLKGKYYIVVKQAYGYGNYNFSYNYSNCGESLEENYSKRNDTKTDAYSISLNKTYKGVLALNEGNDYYKFKVVNNSSVKINFQAELLSACYVDIYDSKGNKVYDTYLTMGTNNCVIDTTIVLAAGEYCLAIVQAYGNGIYNFNLSDQIATPKVTTTNEIGGVKINWNKVEGAVKYNVYRRQGGYSTWTLVGTTTGNTFLDKNVKSGIYYVYSVRAYNASGKYSAFISANTQTRKFMATPKLTTIYNHVNGLAIKWNAVAGVTNGYRVYRRGAGSTYWTYLGTTKNLYFIDNEVKNNSGEYFRYTVIADGGYHSKFDTTGLYLMRLANPTLTSATSSSAGITVKWSAIKGTTGYYVYRKTANSSWVRVAAVGGTNTTTFLDKTAKKGTTYTYTVRAVYGSTTSAYNAGISCYDKY